MPELLTGPALSSNGRLQTCSEQIILQVQASLLSGIKQAGTELMTVTDSAALNNHKIGFMSYWYKLTVLQHSFYIRQPPPQPSWSLYDYDYYYTVHFGFPDNCPLINSDNICFILTVNRVSFEKLPTKTFGSNSWPPANNYTAWLIWILITKALFTRSSILEHVLQLIDIRGKYVAEKKKKDEYV